VKPSEGNSSRSPPGSWTGRGTADCATRELREETGYRAVSVEPLCAIHTSPGFTDERIELFVARAELEGHPEEGIEVVRMPIEQALAATRDRRITDAKTVVGLLLAANA
jgi:ADP-ribose pyrophosphatase